MSSITVQSITSTDARESLRIRGIDVNRSGYRTSGFLIGEVAHNMGAPARQCDYDHWVVTQGILRALDHLTDDEKCETVENEVRQIARGHAVLPYVSTADAEVFANLIENVYLAQRAEQQLAILCRWPQLQNPKSLADDVDTYITHIIAEANEYTALMEHIEVCNDKTNPTSRLNEWVRDYLLIGYMLDNARDLPKDYTEGLTRVEPTCVNAAKILLSGIEGVRAVRDVPIRSLPKIARLIGRYGLTA